MCFSSPKVSQPTPAPAPPAPEPVPQSVAPLESSMTRRYQVASRRGIGTYRSDVLNIPGGSAGSGMNVTTV